MGHIERHLGKTDEDLVLRLFKDWKLYSGCLFNDCETKIKQKLSAMKFDYKEQEVVSLYFNEPVGFGYNRKLEKMLSNFINVVLRGNNESYEIITAYPDLEKGKKTGEYYIFDKDLTDDNNVWNLFLDLYKSHRFDLRLVIDKNPHIRISLSNYSVKIKNGKITIIDSTYYNPKNYTYNLPTNFTSAKLQSLIIDIENFKETYSLFGKKTIDSYVSERLS